MAKTNFRAHQLQQIMEASKHTALSTGSPRVRRGGMSMIADTTRMSRQVGGRR